MLIISHLGLRVSELNWSETLTIAVTTTKFICAPTTYPYNRPASKVSIGVPFVLPNKEESDECKYQTSESSTPFSLFIFPMKISFSWLQGTCCPVSYIYEVYFPASSSSVINFGDIKHICGISTVKVFEELKKCLVDPL